MTKCSIELCDKKHVAKGLCRNHYINKWKLSQGIAYESWLCMKSRCYLRTNSEYESYGGRGIRVCPEWLDNYHQFVLDMGERPTRSHTIDRIDGNGNYEPSNCRWATKREQSINRSVTKLHTIDGVTKPLVEWVEGSSIPKSTIHKRIYEKGWDLKDAITTPPRDKVRSITLNGTTLTVSEWSTILGIKPCTINNRIRKGWSPEMALTA